MVQQRPSDEPLATNISRLPQGYVFVPKGNVFITGKVRKLTKDAGRTLWRVQTVKGQDVGLRCPSEIYNEVLQLEAATRTDREENVIKKDLRDNAKARAAVLRLFPRIPEAEIEKVVERAFEKASGRVGRTALISLDHRVAMAVWAHIRHEHTSYDTLFGRKRKGEPPTIDKEEIRREIRPLNELMFFSWGGTEKLMRSSGLTNAKSEISTKRAQRSTMARTTIVKTRSKIKSKETTKKVTITRPMRLLPRRKAGNRTF